MACATSSRVMVSDLPSPRSWGGAAVGGAGRGVLVAGVATISRAAYSEEHGFTAEAAALCPRQPQQTVAQLPQLTQALHPPPPWACPGPALRVAWP